MVSWVRPQWSVVLWNTQPLSLGLTGVDGCCRGLTGVVHRVFVVGLTRRARGIARRRATRDARATLSRGETHRSEKFARRETARARTRRDRATDARENVNRVAHPGDGSRRRARVFGSRRAVSGARGVLRGETRRSEKFARRDTQRAGRGARIARRASIEAPSVVLVFKVS